MISLDVACPRPFITSMVIFSALPMHIHPRAKRYVLIIVQTGSKVSYPQNGTGGVEIDLHIM